MRPYTVLPVLSLVVGLVAGCASHSASSDPPAEGEVRVSPRQSISGLRFGNYKQTDAEENDFTTLKLSARKRTTSRDLDGLFSGTVKKNGADKAIKGGFQIVRKRIPAPQIAQGSRMANILRFKPEDDSAREVIYQYVRNTLVLSGIDVHDDHEQMLDLVTDASGNASFKLDCSLTKLYDENVFEEGLSMEEYPDIDIEEVEGKFEVDIGSASFDESDQDRIVVEHRSGDDITFKIGLQSEPGDAYRVTVKDKKGRIDAFESDGEKKVADFKCR